jgi:DNA-3-methyladenine glycosylase II
MCNAANRFDKSNFHAYCDVLSAKDADLAAVIKRYGYPPMWRRAASFPALIQIILEQQVSLASAKAAFSQLRKKIGVVTPVKLLNLSDAELKGCYFSRQKIIYSKELASAITQGQLSFNKLKQLPADNIRQNLKTIRGIGDWTVDIFLMMCLQHTDIFPAADIALIKSVKEVKELPAQISIKEVLLIAENWRPFRTIAAYILYHAYLSKRNRVG